MFYRKITAALCSVSLLVGCQTTGNHVWVTDLAAKEVVDGDFPLRGRVKVAKIDRFAENAPANTERAIKLSLRSNGFLASNPSDADYRLDVRIVEVAESVEQRTPEIQKAAEKLNISDQSVIVLNRYVLRSMSSNDFVRDMTILTVYDPVQFEDGILVNCVGCDTANLPALKSNTANATSKNQNDASYSGGIKAPAYTSGAVSKEAELAGAIAFILVVGILSGGRVIPQFNAAGYSGGSPAYGVDKYAHSIREGRAFKNNIHGAIEILSKEVL